MSAAQRRKGKDGEREIVRMAKDAGLEARHTWQTACSANPAERCCDVLIGGRAFQVKRRCRAWGDLYDALANVDGVFIRADSREWLAVVRLTDFLRGR